MNLTLDQYLDGFERSAVDLPELLETWESIDELLQYEYVDQLLWLLRTIPEVLCRAVEERRLVSVSTRIEQCLEKIYTLHEPLAEKMGIKFPLKLL